MKFHKVQISDPNQFSIFISPLFSVSHPFHRNLTQVQRNLTFSQYNIKNFLFEFWHVKTQGNSRNLKNDQALSKKVFIPITVCYLVSHPVPEIWFILGHLEIQTVFRGLIVSKKFERGAVHMCILAPQHTRRVVVVL